MDQLGSFSGLDWAHSCIVVSCGSGTCFCSFMLCFLTCLGVGWLKAEDSCFSSVRTSFSNRLAQVCLRGGGRVGNSEHKHSWPLEAEAQN